MERVRGKGAVLTRPGQASVKPHDSGHAHGRTPACPLDDDAGKPNCRCGPAERAHHPHGSSPTRRCSAPSPPLPLLPGSVLHHQCEPAPREPPHANPACRAAGRPRLGRHGLQLRAARLRGLLQAQHHLLPAHASHRQARDGPAFGPLPPLLLRRWRLLAYASFRAHGPDQQAWLHRLCAALRSHVNGSRRLLARPRPREDRVYRGEGRREGRDGDHAPRKVSSATTAFRL